jgi:hypothetical protein
MFVSALGLHADIRSLREPVLHSKRKVAWTNIEEINHDTMLKVLGCRLTFEWTSFRDNFKGILELEGHGVLFQGLLVE